MKSIADSKLSVEGLHPFLIFTDVSDKGMSRNTKCKAADVSCALDLSSCHRTHKIVTVPSSSYGSDIYLGSFPFKTLLVVSAHEASALQAVLLYLSFQ